MEANLLNNDVDPRIHPKIKIIFHFSDETKIGDLYVYQSYTEIIIYGCEFPPYKLPKFVPILIFALDFINKMINMDQLHFLIAKKKAWFKIKTQFGPFTCNARSVGQEAEVILK